MITLEHLKKVYPGVIPLKDVNAKINNGDVISVIGPSGTGKSTLLRCINLLEKPDGGKIFLDDEEITNPKCNVPKIRQKMGMVFQSFNLFGHLTIIENVMLAPVKLKNISRQEAYNTGMKLLNSVGLANKYLNYPGELSGGQKQRVAIARAMAMNPDVILFDEPTSALDPTMVGEVQAVIRDLANSGITMMIVTHEMKFARSVANKIFYMDEGGIYEEGSPEKIFNNPEREKTRRFIRNLKVLEININNKNFDFPEVISSIENYCNKNLVNDRMRNKLELSFEELVRQILIPVFDKPEINFTAEYSDDDQKIEVFVNYAGHDVNLNDTENKISLSLLKGSVKDLNYLQQENGIYNNLVKFNIAN